MEKRRILGIIITLTIAAVIPLTVILVEQRQELGKKAAGEPPQGIDLDATYIERTPRYFRYCVSYNGLLPLLCNGTNNQKRWPDVGENITYKAHVINKGVLPASTFSYQWLVNDSVLQTGTVSTTLDLNQETVIEFPATWPTSPQKIEFKIDPNNVLPEVTKANNSLSVHSSDLTISIWVERGLYDLFNSALNLTGSYSFEDWIQAQFTRMNERFLQAKYPSSPEGIFDQVKIDKIIIADELDSAGSPLNQDPDKELIDGRWQFTDGDSTNNRGKNGVWQSYVDQFANNIDYGLIHELTHQLGVIDLYRFNLKNDPARNNGVHVLNINGNEIPVSDLPTFAWDQILFEHGGLMGGGDTSPYNNSEYFESHTAAGMNAHYNYRRGYYGEYLFDTPTNNKIKILDSTGNLLILASVALYQKDIYQENFDDTPEITGSTDTAGEMNLSNRPVTTVTTATNHTLKENPFGQISVVGVNGTMLVKVIKDGKEGYGFLLLPDLNLAYWAGHKDLATIIIKTNFPKITALPTTTPSSTPTPTHTITPTSPPPSATPTPFLPGDLNLDDTVNGIDYAVFLLFFGQSNLPANIPADFNGDRTVDEKDFLIFLTHYYERR